MTIELSIIIPTYLREQVLVATCQSVLAAMDPSHMECWVIDDSPTHEPDVEAWLQRQADLGAIHWVRERTGSLTAARNVALLRARGEVALYLDDDVLIPPGLFERHIRWYADPSVAAVTGEVFNCKNPDQPPPMSDPGRNTFRHVGRDEAMSARNISGGNHSVRRAAALAAGGYDPQFVGSSQGEDLDFARRLLDAGFRIWYDPEAWLIHLGARTGGCGVAGTRHWPEWTHSANLFLYAFRHGRRQGNFLDMCWRALRNGPLRKENVVNPGRWWMAWSAGQRGLRYGWQHRHPPPPLTGPNGRSAT